MKISQELTRGRQFLSDSMSDGWCPYSLPGKTASTEATAWSAIALADSQADIASQAAAFLLTSQNPDGGWSTAPGLGKSDWTTGPAVLALRLISHYQPGLINQQIIDPSLRIALRYLLNSRTDFLPPVIRLLLFLSRGQASLHYGRGWPWTPNCYNWVEPTAYCLMAMKYPYAINGYLPSSAIFHANKFLLDRVCKGGGWNHGASYCLGYYYPPYVVTTAEALLALTDMVESKKIKDGLDYLNNIQPNNHSAMSLAWTILALDAYGLDCGHNLSLLARRQHENGSFGSTCMVTALSLLALNTANGINYFKINMGHH